MVAWHFSATAWVCWAGIWATHCVYELDIVSPLQVGNEPSWPPMALIIHTNLGGCCSWPLRRTCIHEKFYANFLCHCHIALSLDLAFCNGALEWIVCPNNTKKLMWKPTEGCSLGQCENATHCKQSMCFPAAFNPGTTFHINHACVEGSGHHFEGGRVENTCTLNLVIGCQSLQTLTGTHCLLDNFLVQTQLVWSTNLSPNFTSENLCISLGCYI